MSPLAQAHSRRVDLISVTGRRFQVGPIQAGAQSCGAIPRAGHRAIGCQIAHEYSA